MMKVMQLISESSVCTKTATMLCSCSQAITDPVAAYNGMRMGDKIHSKKTVK